jgi:hypothetical protein
MKYFILAAILTTLLVKRNPLSIVETLKLRFPYLLIGGFILQIILYIIALSTGHTYPLWIELSISAVIVCLWFNRKLPGIPLIFTGAVLNFAAMVIHGGLMPVSQKAARLAGLGDFPEQEARHQMMTHSHFWWLGDWIPFIGNVLSPGDVFIGFGFIWFMVGSSARRRQNEG